ncbi:helix-turn-helix domain-containing protein [Streptosporangium canum]|uniref:helix-turn-helix domain-containing protein n=1 Tax=Streptosporangium canum TaxID=324952 RepID=UPI0037B12C11
MRYAQGSWLTAVQRTKRERVRLRAAELFAQGYTDAQVAKELRVIQVSANRWRRSAKTTASASGRGRGRGRGGSLEGDHGGLVRGDDVGDHGCCSGCV